jgi:hypothetical protein
VNAIHLFPAWHYGTSKLDVPYPQQPLCRQNGMLNPDMIFTFARTLEHVTCKQCRKRQTIANDLAGKWRLTR